MSQTPPLVTCVIPTHNRARLVERAVRSALAQTYANLEVVVVDDGSTDGTTQALAGLSAETDRVRLARHEAPRGACAARNTGIREARGEYVAGLDDDDEWLPGRVERMLAALLEAGDDCAYAYSGYFRRKGTKLTPRRVLPRMTYEQFIRHHHNPVGTQILVRRDLILEAGLFDESLPASQDADMFCRLLRLKPFAVGLPEPLMIVDASERVARISQQRRKVFSGKFRVYNKHRRNMDREIRTERLYNIRKILHPCPSLSRILWMSPPKARMRELRRYAKHKILNLARLRRTGKA